MRCAPGRRAGRQEAAAGGTGGGRRRRASSPLTRMLSEACAVPLASTPMSSSEEEPPSSGRSAPGVPAARAATRRCARRLVALCGAIARGPHALGCAAAPAGRLRGCAANFMSRLGPPPQPLLLPASAWMLLQVGRMPGRVMDWARKRIWAAAAVGRLAARSIARTVQARMSM